MNESCHTFERKVECRRHNRRCKRVYGWVMSHFWISHDTLVCESYHALPVRDVVMSHLWMSNITFVKESYHTWLWIKKHVWMSYTIRVNESVLVYEDIWLFRKCDITHSQMWHENVISFANVILLCERQRHATRMNESCITCEWVILHLRTSQSLSMSHGTRVNESCCMYSFI